MVSSKKQKKKILRKLTKHNRKQKTKTNRRKNLKMKGNLVEFFSSNQKNTLFQNIVSKINTTRHRPIQIHSESAAQASIYAIQRL